MATSVLISGGVSRRSFIRLAGGGSLAAAALPLLSAACTPAAPQPTTGAPPAGATAASGAKSVVPSYIPATGGPKPDFASAGPLYEDGFANYPMNPVKALPATPPGTGSTITSLNIGLYPLPNPVDQNPAWQEVNKQLNANVQFNIVGNPGDYPAKLATTMAGGDLPDLMYIQSIGAAANLPQFLDQKCADLTPYLGGDAAKDYPYLAAIPTFAWQNSGAAVNGKLQMVPLERYAPGGALFKNQTVYDAEIGKDYVPKDADDLKRIYAQLNKPNQGRWATAAYSSNASATVLGNAYHIAWYSSLFGAPNNWRLESNGNLTRNIETAEFRDAVSYVRDLVGAGYFHPNTPTYNINSARADFIAGRWIVYPEGFGNPWNDFWRRGLQLNPPVNFLLIPPFPAHAGNKPVTYLSSGNLGATAFKQASPDRIKELLRVLNWLAAPFGSQEDLLLTSGIKDVDYTLDPKGNPILTDRGNNDANYVPWKYIVQHPQVMYVPDIPNYAQTLYNAEHVLIPAGIADPSLGYYAPSLTKLIAVNQAFTDGIVEIMSGRQAMTGYDQLVTDWKNNGGDQVRKELQDAIAASKK